MSSPPLFSQRLCSHRKVARFTLFVDLINVLIANPPKGRKGGRNLVLQVFTRLSLFLMPKCIIQCFLSSSHSIRKCSFNKLVDLRARELFSRK